jgi:2-keto-4-pentenoate hydratase/2-oxohepta-3-ene-1,7-dioic acid hydratase in catechol pathway
MSRSSGIAQSSEWVAAVTSAHHAWAAALASRSVFGVPVTAARSTRARPARPGRTRRGSPRFPCTAGRWRDRNRGSPVEHEADLAIVIGNAARFVSSAEAFEYIFGYTCANDVSAKDLQRKDPHPTRGKGFDTFCPVRPWIETDLDPTAGVPVRCSVNG